VALLALVAITFAALVGISASGIGSSVLAGLQRGICAVAPGPCPRIVAVKDDLEACELERTSRRERLGETIGVVELGSSGTLAVVRRSDGRVTVTLANGSDVGAVWRVGAKVAVGAEAGAEAKAGAGLAWGSGRTWTLPDEAAAADFISRFGDKATITGKLVDQVRSRCSLLCDAIGWRPHEQLPEPDEVFAEGGVSAKLAASFGLGAAPSEAGVSGSGVLGRRTSREGATTWYVALTADAAAELNLPIGAIELAGDAQAVLAYEVDADGKPQTLRISVAGEASGRTSLALGLRGRGRLSSADGRAGELAGGVVEVEAALDLTDPALRATAADLLDALDEPRALPGRVRALGANIADRAQIDVRTYRTRSSDQKYGASLALGVGVGGSFEKSSDGLELVSALTRLPGLPFLDRDDCRSA
jgi:hypothetical protein